MQYRVTALQRWIEEAVRTAGIEIVLGAVLRGVRREGRRIGGLELATRYGDVEVAARGFVDASGDAALAWTAGLDCREPGQDKIFGTAMFSLEGFDEKALSVFDRADLRARLAAKGDAYGIRRHDGFIFVVPGAGEALVNSTHVETPLDPVGASRAMLDGRAQVDRLVGFLRTEFPAVFANARVRTYALPGIRQTRWIVGAYQLTAADVRDGKRFDDAVVRCSWPMEVHNRPEGVTGRSRRRPHALRPVPHRPCPVRQPRRRRPLYRRRSGGAVVGAGHGAVHRDGRRRGARARHCRFGLGTPDRHG